jgi:pimeloyl-ACP methyl ester carboxylesterase
MPQIQASLLFLILITLTLYGFIHARVDSSCASVTPELEKGNGADRRLFVLVHGFLGQSKAARKGWASIARALEQHGDVLYLRYPASRGSNADPLLLAQGIRDAIRKRYGSYDRVVLVGHSIGALLLRRAVVNELRERPADSWIPKLDRLVLLAGMNRGWDVSGQKPMDMYWHRKAAFWWGSWLGDLTSSGKLIRSMEIGRPFVANLRLEWMDLAKPPRVVQLLGDIDDVVSEEDNKDLRAAVSSQFVWLRVRGTGHGDILDLTDTTEIGPPGQTIGAYRQAKLLFSATGDWTEVVRANEESRFEQDEAVSHVVFVLHGIRDLGKWSAGFDQELQREFRQQHGRNGKLAVVSVRYGFFGMGQFLLNASRDKYVRWFVDQYTETRARFPNAKRVDFVGHSNGTYLLARALAEYPAVRVDRVVLGGSVVPKGYEWKPDQVKSVRNYVASRDWVVALFPRFFESHIVRRLGVPIGSAGFNGFRWNGVGSGDIGPGRRFNNVEIFGSHSAFLKRSRAIAEYLVSDQPRDLAVDRGAASTPVLRWISDWGVGIVWLGLLLGVILLGVRVTGAATHPGWPVFLLYLAALVMALRWV